ncbi:glycosyltransferase family 9 protein [Desulfovibrio aminophilus]|uniref:glycosyltransferase family 9 protein n=1 Tax=Desulfovibrio aminophilus TaxID=81425 RepID=UPI003391E998
MKHVLVVQLARFGDLVQTKRLILSLCARPDTQVHLCLDSSLEPLARLVYPKVVTHPLAAHGTGLATAGPEALFTAMLNGNRRAFAGLTAQRFEAVYNLNRSPLNLALASLFDPGQVRGYAWRHGQPLQGPWPELAMRWSGQRRLGINLVDFWGHFTTSPVPPETVNPLAMPGGGGVGVVLAGRESRRSLPPEVLARIAAAAYEHTGRGRLLLLGSKAEIPAAKAVLRALPGRLTDKVTDLSGQTDWAGLVDALSGMDRVLTPDTGTMHLAAHLGVPVTAFFLSSAWCFETGPYGQGHTVHQAVLDCLPCLESRPCHLEHLCLTPFADPGFVRFLVTGKSEHAPKDILSLRAGFDVLGQTYASVAGEDADREQRLRFRAFLSRHLGLPDAEKGVPDTGLAERFYQERDWFVQKKQLISNNRKSLDFF